MISKFKNIVLGGAKNPKDSKIFHHLSLVAFLAWVGLGADGLSSSCYGPEEAFLALQGHTYLGIFVALAAGLTVFIIAISYSQIIELFPTGGGGYLVASKLLSPTVGMISGSALLIDYVLTITISIASGADAIFSFLPREWYAYRLEFAIFGLVVLTIMNLRGVKEAVMPLVPIFIAFVVLHLFAILYAIFTHIPKINEVYTNTSHQVTNSIDTLGIFGVLFIILKAFSMGAGTFTGIEAVSNGLPILREPKEVTGKRTMIFMAVSLAFTVVGLMIAYLLFGVQYAEGKTLNAVLFESMTFSWGTNASNTFVFLILLSEAVLLFIAAQAGFLDGPRVLASMAADRWLPTRFAMMSDRLVTHYGIILMGSAAFLMMLFTKGNVKLLVVLYSINVFITFSLSQLGMVRHWWLQRKNVRVGKNLFINGLGLIVTSFILISVMVIKFEEGGWITIIITGSLIFLALRIKKHYKKTAELFNKLDTIVDSVRSSIYNSAVTNIDKGKEIKTTDKTAVVLVNGFNGLGLHTLLSIMRLFGSSFKNFVFIQVGAIDAGNFKGTEEIDRLEKHIKKESNKYVSFINNNGYHAEAFTAVGIDIVQEIENITPTVREKYPNSVFFGGQIVFEKETFATKWLHNNIVFSVQSKLYKMGIPLMILPIKI